MKDYRRVPTSIAVYDIIRTQHPELVVLSTYTNNTASKGIACTSYGFVGCVYPLLEIESQWDLSEPWTPENTSDRYKYKYWLCYPLVNE